MDKREYLELAKRNGWDKKIPQLEDGTYDCDVFGGDDVVFDFDINITGNFFLGDDAATGDISVGGDVILGDDADICTISAGGDVVLGNTADTCDISAGGIVVIDSTIETHGYCISAGDEIIYADEPAT